VAFDLMKLPYSYDALEPYMSAETLQYHHDKHHQAYVDMLNKLLPGSGFEGLSLEEIVKASYGKNQAVFNNAGQDFNHNNFWPWMKKGGGGKKVPGSVLALIDRDLGGFDKFREAFIEAGKTQFGSGWCWLTMKDGKLAVTKTPTAFHIAAATVSSPPPAAVVNSPGSLRIPSMALSAYRNAERMMAAA